MKRKDFIMNFVKMALICGVLAIGSMFATGAMADHRPVRTAAANVARLGVGAVARVGNRAVKAVARVGGVVANLRPLARVRNFGARLLCR